MRFMVIVYPGDLEGYETGKMPSEELITAMGNFNTELVEKGVMRAGEGLHPSGTATRIHFGGGQAGKAVQGPFNDNGPVIGGFWIWEVESKEAAVEWARRAPMQDGDVLEVRQVFESEEFGDEVAEQENELRRKMKEQQEQSDG